MDAERFEKQIRFILEIDKEKEIFRQTHISGGKRRENDAEHAWHMAIMVWLLSEYSNKKIDICKTILMVLTHDLVEVYAGDTYAYDTELAATQKEREAKAAEKLFGILPADQGEKLKNIWEEFEKYETPEACFAHTMDNFQPMLLNDSNDGGDWTAHGVKRAQVEKRNEKTASGSEEIWEYMRSVIDRNVEKGSLKSE